MPTISNAVKRWMPFKGSLTDKVQIRYLHPGERQLIIDDTTEIKWVDGVMTSKPLLSQRKIQFMYTMICDWRGFCDEDGAELPCNKKNIITAMCQHELYDEVMLLQAELAKELDPQVEEAVVN